jgi:hypothetical protein
MNIEAPTPLLNVLNACNVVVWPDPPEDSVKRKICIPRVLKGSSIESSV